MRLRILTAVWGRAFAERFVHFTLRSLMAPGNLLDLAKRNDVVYEIHAPLAEIDWIKGHSVFAQVSANVVIHFHQVSPSDIDVGNAMDHWTVWTRAVARARTDNVYVILVAPDQVFARGTFLRWAELFEQGYLAVFCTGYQTVLETVVDDLTKRFPERVPIDLPVTELRSVILQHLHPIMIAMFRSSPRWIAHPEWHLRAELGAAVMQRVLASHAYAFHPGQLRMTTNFCPLEHFDRVAFEPSCFFGVEPFLKQLGLYLRPWRMDDVTLSYYGVWADQFVANVNLVESRIGHLVTVNGDAADRTLRRLQSSGDFYVGQMMASRAIIRVWRTLQESGLYFASRWVAAAHLHGRLRRRLPMRGPLTLFVPADDVLIRLDPSNEAQLLVNQGANLIALLRSHVSPGRHFLVAGDRMAEVPGGTIQTRDGRSYCKSATGPILILAGPMRVDDVEIFVIDAVLAPLVLRTKNSQFSVLVRNRARHSFQRLYRRGRATALRMLSRDRRLYDLTLRIRELWFGRHIHSHASSPIPKSALALYQRALALRSLQAIRDICRFYSAEVLGDGSPEHAPETYLSNLGAAKDDDVKSLLREAVTEAPTFAEAWLELGYLLQEAGEAELALEAFGHAHILPAALTNRVGRPDVGTIAAMESSNLLACLGRTSEGLAILETISDPRYAHWSFHLASARMLLLAGRSGDALAAFERCLRWQGAEPILKGFLPKTIDDLRRATADV